MTLRFDSLNFGARLVVCSSVALSMLAATTASAHNLVLTTDLVHRPWWDFVQLGMTHIFSGADHLAFVFCLCMVARGAQLVWLVSAFTLGHSLSLALAYFGVVAVPSLPVEATIALSVALMAREALVGRGHRHHALVVVAFGLLHGLGFASALHDLMIPRGERALALLGFNFGVELGQLAFVAVVTVVFRLAATVRFPLRLPLLYAAGTLGLFWTFQRLAAF